MAFKASAYNRDAVTLGYILSDKASHMAKPNINRMRKYSLPISVGGNAKSCNKSQGVCNSSKGQGCRIESNNPIYQSKFLVLLMTRLAVRISLHQVFKYSPYSLHVEFVIRIPPK